MGKLTALKVKALATPGRYPDGDGLMLLVKESGSKSWVARLQHEGKRRDFGLGSTKDVSLAEAREALAELRKTVRAGGDPLAEKRLKAAKSPAIATFSTVAQLAYASSKEGWRNKKHSDQWISSLQAYAFPLIGNLPIEKVDAAAVISVLSPIWMIKPETARRVKQRVGAVLDWAFSQGLRPSEAPMRAISKGLPRQPKKDGHFAALPYTDVKSVFSKLGEQNTSGRLALRFLILTAARSGEVRGATWDEIHFTNSTWVIPATRMKAREEHVVPLSAAALEILTVAKTGRLGLAKEPIFPGLAGKHLSDMTLTKALRAATSLPSTVHGFRSSFRDWAAEKTEYDNAVVEAALAHTNPNRVEAAYKRTKYLEKRRPLMTAWASYIEASAPTISIGG